MDKEIDEKLNICDPELIEDIKLAVDVEILPTEFTITDIERWLLKSDIKKNDGTAYAKISREQLVNYAKYTPVTKKRKQRVLYTNYTEKLFSFNPLIHCESGKL